MYKKERDFLVQIEDAVAYLRMVYKVTHSQRRRNKPFYIASSRFLRPQIQFLICSPQFLIRIFATFYYLLHGGRSLSFSARQPLSGPESASPRQARLDT